MKQTEIKKLSKQDLGDKLVEYKKKLLELKMSHAVSPIENPSQIRNTRRLIARIKTAITNKKEL
ncbi:MAG: 50S ribosomal protein L29 [Bacteroidota bacterium]|nr:50S ribosomal protein L29 [Bacteroidota bacterium]|tara:strand:+ start:232 stop:423 length:192 start_codon:yes stop_codon:yes gene_type:complete